jgi:fructokinase
VFTVVGEALVDLIEDTPDHPVAYPGGSPANVAVALARLGQPVQLLTQLGDDPHGQLLLAHLRDNDVRLAPGSLLDCPRTSTARTSLSSDGQARYTFDIAWQHFEAPRRLDAPSDGWADPTTTCLHTGSLATVLAPGADDVAAIVHAARETSTISFDPNCRPTLIEDVRSARNRCQTLVADSDVVKASLEDLAWLYPGRAYQEVGQEWLDRGCGLVVITMGGDGAWACTRHRETAVSAFPVDVVDTVGAGDAFTAGLLSALGQAGLLGVANRAALSAIDEETLGTVVTFAARVAAATCGRRGADPPMLTDLVTPFATDIASDPPVRR